MIALLLWLSIALAVLIVSLFVGFVIESQQTPFMLALVGLLLAALVFLLGFVFHIIRIMRKRESRQAVN